MNRDPQRESFSAALKAVRRFADSPNFWGQQIHKKNPIFLAGEITSLPYLNIPPVSTCCNNQVSILVLMTVAAQHPRTHSSGLENIPSHLLNTLPMLAVPAVRDLHRV